MRIRRQHYKGNILILTELILPSLPSGLIVKPALVWKIAPTNTDKVRFLTLVEDLIGMQIM